MKQTTRSMILSALFAALCAILSQIYFPLPFTPIIINLATIAVFMAGGLLGAKWGAVSMAVYVLLGLVGLPVFSGFSGGPGVLAGPTGGYIIGYIVAAAVTGLLSAKSTTFGRYALAMTAGMLSYDILGTLWFMISTNTSFGPSLVMCVLPFLPGDALKILLSALLCKKIAPIVRR